MKNKNNINPNHFWCPWCDREKLPGRNWEDGPAEIPETAADKICPECAVKLFKANGIPEEEVVTV